MKLNNLFVIGLLLLISSCEDYNDIDRLVIKEWEATRSNKCCVVDFSKTLFFDWDSMYYFSGAYSLEDINKYLGRKVDSFTDIGDRVVFVNNGYIIRHYEWCKYFDGEPQGVVFSVNSNTFSIDKNKAIFLVQKKKNLYMLSFYNQ